MAIRNRRDSMARNTNNKNDPQRSTALERSVRKSLEGLNVFDGNNLVLISDVDQERWIFGSYDKSLTHPLVHTNRDINKARIMTQQSLNDMQ